MQIEATKLIFIMNFSVLDFFRFTSRMPQIAQIKLVSTFKIFRGVGGVGGGGMLPDPLRNVLFFFISSGQSQAFTPWYLQQGSEGHPAVGNFTIRHKGKRKTTRTGFVCWLVA